jgi:hypothetical protein
MTLYPYRHVTPHPPDTCIDLLRTALENQHLQGVEVRPGWRHCSRMVFGSLGDRRVKLYGGKLDMQMAILYADVLNHEDGSEIIGVFRVGQSSRIFLWIFRVFFSVLLLGPVAILLLAKLNDPQAIPGLPLSITVIVILGIYAALMWGSKKMLTISREDVLFLQRFIEKSTSR